jgi:hypothetical protein
MKTNYENSISIINKDQEQNMKHIAHIYSITSTSQETLDPEIKVEHNLQNHSPTHKLSNTKKETYSIPTIINGPLSREGTSWTMQRRTLQQGKKNPNTTRKRVKSACRRHRLLLIGYSHIRGL